MIYIYIYACNRSSVQKHADLINRSVGVVLLIVVRGHFYISEISNKGWITMNYRYL